LAPKEVLASNPRGESMPTLTIRNVSPQAIESLKRLAERKGHSMEQEVRELLESHALDRMSVLQQVEALWGDPATRATAEEVDRWIRDSRQIHCFEKGQQP
jgi:plasmid stability protein